MGTYTKTYVYNVHNPSGGRQYRYSTENIPFSSFSFYSGDTSHRILKILSVSASTRVFRPQGAPTGYSGFRIILTAGTNTYTSEWATARIGDSSWTDSLTSAIAGMLPERNWSEATQVSVEKYNDGSGGESGTGFNRYPLYLTITFSDSEYLPKIENYDGGRWDNEHSVADDEASGMQYSYTLSLGRPAASVSDGASYIRLVYGNSAITLASASDGGSLTALNALIGSAQTGYVPDNTFNTGTNFNVALEFCYCGEISEPLAVPLPRAFANVWESGEQTGGIAFGKFGSSTLNNPKFECAYPSYFESGIFDANGNAIGGNNIDDEDDPVKIGKFLGRDMYRIVIQPTSTGAIMQSFNPTDVVKIYGYVRFTNGVRYCIPYYHDSSHYARCYIDDQNRVQFATAGGTFSSAVIVIEYT